MPTFANRGTAQGGRWCALIVLLAVCALTVSVATRYCSPESSSAHAVTTAHKTPPVRNSRQRLTKLAAYVIPQLICSAMVHVPAAYPLSSAVEPIMPRTHFEKSLYNRPPPFSAPHA